METCQPLMSHLEAGTKVRFGSLVFDLQITLISAGN